MAVTGDYHKVVITKVLPIDQKTLFSAFTDPQKMKQWFYIDSWDVDIRNNLKVGEQYCIKMQSEDGLVSSNSGVYKEIDPPRRLVFTWAIIQNPDSLVTVDLKSMDPGTKLTLTHDKLPNESYYFLHLWSWRRCIENLITWVENLRQEKAEMA